MREQKWKDLKDLKELGKNSCVDRMIEEKEKEKEKEKRKEKEKEKEKRKEGK